MFPVVPQPIIRSANNCIYSIWYLSHRYCDLPLSWKSWNSPTHKHHKEETCPGLCRMHYVKRILNVQKYVQKSARNNSKKKLTHKICKQTIKIASYAYLEQRTSYSNSTPYSSNEYSRHNVPLLKTTNPIHIGCLPGKITRLRFLYLNIHIIQSLIYYYYYTISVFPHSLLKFIIRKYTRFLFQRLHSYLTRIINQYT